MSYWLFKSEPHKYSIDDLKRDGTTLWDGVRNFQARNFMRDAVRAGDKVLFYASSSEPSGVVGLAEVVTDPMQEKADDPRWLMVKIKFVEKFPQVFPLAAMRATKGLERMLVVRRGMRVSIQPVTKEQFDIVVKRARSARD